VLAVVIVPLVLITVLRAWKADFRKHVRIARWTLPIWFYVSVTGVVIYVMLYQLFPPIS
jgi:putative membrane protein